MNLLTTLLISFFTLILTTNIPLTHAAGGPPPNPCIYCAYLYRDCLSKCRPTPPEGWKDCEGYCKYMRCAGQPKWCREDCGWEECIRDGRFVDEVLVEASEVDVRAQ